MDVDSVFVKWLCIVIAVHCIAWTGERIFSLYVDSQTEISAMENGYVQVENENGQLVWRQK